MVLTPLLAAAALVAVASAPPAALVSTLPSCASDALSYGFDSEGGLFDGMSQSGTLFVVRNVGPAACRTSALPRLQLEDGQGQPVAAARRTPVGMHPGPVILPIALAPGAEATSALHWVEGDVYDGHNCVSVARVRIGGEGRDVTIPLRAHICGPAGKPVPFDQPPLRTDPILKPAR